jgi:hypothetical protein
MSENSDRDPKASTLTPSQEDGEELETFGVEIVDIFGELPFSLGPNTLEILKCLARIPCLELVHPSDEHQNTALIREGYISSSPINPSTAISIRTLKLFKQLRQYHPRFSVQAFTKVLCESHNVCSLHVPWDS